MLQLLSFDKKYLILPGERTFGVLTKLDLMDKGTNALEVSTSSVFECFFRKIVPNIKYWSF